MLNINKMNKTIFPTKSNNPNKYNSPKPDPSPANKT